jgi:DNA-binding protein HU-beta
MALKKITSVSARKPVASTKTPAPKAKPIAKKAAATPVKVTSSAKTKIAEKKVAASTVTVTLKHLAAELGEQHNLSKREAEGLVSDLFERLVGHIKAGDKLRLSGLGVLEIKSRPARMGRNPATGASIKIAASRKLAFRPAKDLKESI